MDYKVDKSYLSRACKEEAEDARRRKAIHNRTFEDQIGEYFYHNVYDRELPKDTKDLLNIILVI